MVMSYLDKSISKSKEGKKVRFLSRVQTQILLNPWAQGLVAAVVAFVFLGAMLLFTIFGDDMSKIETGAGAGAGLDKKYIPHLGAATGVVPVLVYFLVSYFAKVRIDATVQRCKMSDPKNIKSCVIRDISRSGS